MKIPDSVRTSLSQRLNRRRRDRWPQLKEIRLRFYGSFAYVDGIQADGEVMRLCRLNYASSAAPWGFAIYLASKDGYERSVLPSGNFAGTPEEALDCACGLYLRDPSAWRIGRSRRSSSN